MNRGTEFRISRRPYAVDLSSLRGTSYESWEIDAVWFRRRRGETVAVWGQLWDFQTPAPVDGLAFLANHKDGRYGGRARARWDGDTLWTDGLSHAESEKLLTDVLRPMLDNFPDTPAGFDGWWTFQ